MPKQQTPHEQAVEAMFDYVLNSFSRNHKIERTENDFRITNQKASFFLKTFSEESIKGSSEEVKAELENLIKIYHVQGIATGFLLLRCFTDYEKRRNSKGFLKQSWGDNYNIKKLARLERAIEAMYNSGTDIRGHGSRIVYFNPKTGDAESVRFMEMPNTDGYVCDWKCIKNLYGQGERIDHERCKTEKGCTLYAKGREKRNIRISELKPPLRMEVYKHGALFLAEIKGS